MDQQTADAAFEEWLAGFKARYGGNLAAVFVSTAMLREAFLAGVSLPVEQAGACGK